VRNLVLFACSALAFVAAPSGLLAFIPIAVFAIAFSIGYPTLLSIYSLSVDEPSKVGSSPRPSTPSARV
jgi:hypothetical protein